MKRANFLTVVALGSAIGSPVLAKLDACYAPISEWQPRNIVKKFVKDQGWKLRRIKVDDGCYEVYAWNGDGKPIEAKVDPATLDIVEMSFEKYSPSESDNKQD